MAEPVARYNNPRRLTASMVIAALPLFGCGPLGADSAAPGPTTELPGRPPPGSNLIMRAPVTDVDGLEVIISDVVIPPNATVPRHYHPGEEFLYVLEGSSVHVEEGQPDRILKAGDSYVIPPRAIHAPRGGAAGARAVVFRLHVHGKEERILVPE